MPAGSSAVAQPADIPLPEHPRPDHHRDAWVNLNGPWDFGFDDAATPEGVRFDREITVPFSWGAPLSGVEDEGDVGWYRRTIDVPASWAGRRVFLVVGASDWTTTGWLDGTEIGTHRGGYTPFEFELTPHIDPGASHELVLRVDDTPHDFKLEGKQGYGPARGLWQTAYLEARGGTPIDIVHFTPDLERERVVVDIALLDAVRSAGEQIEVEIDGVGTFSESVPTGASSVRLDVPVPDAHLWTLDDPFLYDAVVRFADDTVLTYFGMRSISVVDLPEHGHPYVALNGEPVYLEMALDQSYHPEGYYTFPSDAFMRDEILRSRQIGLNAMRVHIKVEIPRKLYWADRLGMLIMADVPNSWGQPGPEMRQEVEYAMERMIERDYNHPSIFAWVPFNESWGLKTPVEGEGQFEGDVILPETQEWVMSVYRRAKELDPTRLVEDNSVCCFGHTETDINSWHVYTAGYAMADHLDEVVAKTYEGSDWNFLDGRTQGRQPLINSEFGNVWGYEGSTGDVDWSWDYHIFMNEFRRRPKVAGWLYTEHHDVINEWNGYWRYDRSEKFTGLDELVDGMSLRDLHAPFYVVVGEPSRISSSVDAGATVEVPLWASFMTGSTGVDETLRLEHELYGWDTLGRRWSTGVLGTREVDFRPWRSEALDPLSVTMPAAPGLAVLAVRLRDASGAELHRNFVTFVVEGDTPSRVRAADGSSARVVGVPASAFSAAEWTLKQWDVLDGLKVNGAGSGFFEYRMPWPSNLQASDVSSARFVFEASAKQLLGKDRSEYQRGGDYMRGGGAHDPALNPNAYPMTDETPFPSAVQVSFNGMVSGVHELMDDPADHRGILSWHSQLEDRRLREAGSYGYLIEAAVPAGALAAAAESGELVVRLDVSDALPHGLAIYGSRFGRYPVDPSLILVLDE